MAVCKISLLGFYERFNSIFLFLCFLGFGSYSPARKVLPGVLISETSLRVGGKVLQGTAELCTASAILKKQCLRGGKQR